MGRRTKFGFGLFKRCEKCGKHSTLFNLGVHETYKTFRCTKFKCRHIEKVPHNDTSIKLSTGL